VRRRKFVGVVAALALGWPLSARTQSALPVIGFLNSGSPELVSNRLRAFREGLKEQGFVEGHNVTIEYRFADGRYDRLPGLAAELVRQGVKVIAATGALPSQLAAKSATRTIPIVFSTGADPVAVGLVESLNRPGGNLTGVTTLNVDLAAKRLEILRELLPASTLVALLINPNTPASETITNDMRKAAPRFGLDLHILHAVAESDFEPAIIAAAKSGAGGLVIGTDALFNNSAERLGGLALIHKVPTVFQFREFVAAGGLMSYGGSLTDDYRQVGAYTGRILKGARPAELAVERSTKVELFLNLTSAKALGVPIGPSLLARADEVIE
jgi:putative ABC transport system substrate-binding protein